jgi:predicted small integral membrane protein
MITTRYAKIALTFGLALFGLAVTIHNVMDDHTNFVFLQHVLSIDTTFPGSALIWRAITAPILDRIGYGLPSRQNF